ncbi:MAG: hypothetical protein GEU87_14305 [Alphaproteobacteria bacterium]|nr:hypothetical protein [Alphaproteobacteria bacterium]
MTWEKIAARLVEALRDTLGRADITSHEKLDTAFNVVAAYRAARLKPLLVDRCGLTVQSGPFAGMRMLDRVSEGAFIPKLLGSYETELQAVLETAADSGYDTIINIGCAEGYYAVGLARRTGATIHAFDIDERARRLCRELAELNGVEDKVTLAAEFLAGDFSRYAGRRVLVLCDVEGAECALFDPAACPALRHMDLLIEIHRVGGRWSSEMLYPRFEGSHAITEICQEPRDATAYPALDGMPDADRFFALLERVEPTRWAFFRSVQPAGANAPTA